MVEHAAACAPSRWRPRATWPGLPQDTSSELIACPEDLNAWRHDRRTATRLAVTTSGSFRDGGSLRREGLPARIRQLVFHFSLLGLLVAVAVGKLFGYEGNVIVIADGGPGFCSRRPRVDSSAGNTVDARRCTRFASGSTTFRRTTAVGQATSFASDIDYQDYRPQRSDGEQLATLPLEVNHPLRIGGDRIYLQGHGYAPTFTVTFRTARRARRRRRAMATDNPQTLLSSGVARIDHPQAAIPTPSSAVT